MSFSLVPDQLYADYTAITPQMLQSWGIRLLLCDLDYTLAPRSVARPDKQVLAWVQAMKDAGLGQVLADGHDALAAEAGEDHFTLFHVIQPPYP